MADEVINIVNNKRKQTNQEEIHHRQRKECRVMYRVAALAGLGGLVLAAYWMPVLAIPAAWILFAAAVVTADRHLRRK